MARPKVTSQIVAGRQARVVKVTPGPAAFRSCKPSSAGASFRRFSVMRTTGSAWWQRVARVRVPSSV